MKDKTALVIAHRLSTIRHLDRIIVLDEGMYAKLWGHQSGEFLES